MLGALGRAVGAVVNSSDPLHETKALSQGLGQNTSKTAALIKGQSDVVTYASSVNASPSPAGDLRCFVDPATGQLLGLEQSGTAACSVASDVVVVVVPLSTGSYISQVKLAYTYDGAFVGRLVFELKADATAKAVSYTCGSAGGKAVSLLPSDRDYVVTKFAVGCAPLPAIDGGIGGSGRRLQGVQGLGLSAGSFGVTAAPLSVLPVDPVTSIPLTPSLAPSPWFGRAPSAPTIGAVTSPEAGQLVVPFAASADAGVPPVADFAVKCLRGSALPSPTCSATGPGVYTQTVSANASPLVATFASLPSDSYVCYVIANNGFDGYRCSAASATVAVVAPPSAPLVDTATSSNAGSIFVRFRASVDPGTPSVTNYAVRCVDTSTNATPTCASPGPSVGVPASGAAPLTGTLTGLVGGTSYVCFVVANNGVAPGDVCSSASNAVTIPLVPPSAPAISDVSSPGVGVLDVSFTASSNTGNPPVVQYVVKCARLRSGGVVLPSCLATGTAVYTQPVSPAATPLQATFSSLPGDTYACFAIADNGFGGFTCSSASSLIGVTGPPNAPTMGAAAWSSSRELMVTFQASSR